MITAIQFLVKLILLLTLWSCPSIFADERALSPLDADSESILNTKSERIMGDLVMQKIYGSNFLVEDPVVNEYLGELAQIFSKEAHLPPDRLHFFGVNTPELNAFAFFGGHVAVHSGLILAVDNESELAAVLAHETAHITQHHLARMIAANRQVMPVTFAEVLAALAVGALGSPEAGFHLATAALAGHMQQMINFTREHEQEADRIGIQLLSKTNFDPAALASVFQKMKQNTAYHDHPPEYLLTHPVFDSRIADAENRAALFPNKRSTDSLSFHLIRARLEVAKEESTAKKIRRLRDNLANPKTPKVATEYAYALALLKNQQVGEALPILEKLERENSNHWMIEMSLAEAEDAAKQSHQALNRASKLLQTYPKNYAIIFQQASLLLKNKHPDKAIKLLLLHRKSHAKDPFLHQMLARAYSMVHQTAELHRSQAEWHLNRGEFKEAFVQLDLALESAENNPMLTQLIEERQEGIKQIIEQQKNISF